MQGAAARGEDLLRGARVFLRDAERVDPRATSTASASPRPHSRSARPRPPQPRARSNSPPPCSPSVSHATRRGALLHALRTNPAILLVDPAAEERSAMFFAA